MEPEEENKTENFITNETTSLQFKDSELLFELGKLFTTTEELDKLLNGVMSAIANQEGIIRGSISIYHEEDESIEIDASIGYSPEEVKRGKYKPGEGITGIVFKSGKPKIVPSIKNEPLFLNRTKSREYDSHENVAYICLPIKIAEKTVGIISIDIAKEETSSFDHELNYLTTIAIMIAHAVNDRKEIRQRETQLEEENKRLKIRLKDMRALNKIVGSSTSMKELYENILIVAPTNSTVLITGETGTGKELIADAIYENSQRNNKPFVKVNIASLPENLIESELFGYEKGAFTGALTSKKGRFEMANGGTIFLDEIGDLNPSLQVKLLRVLQEKLVEPLGSTKTIPLDIRVIAATHQDLESKITKNEFRQDLFYRLNVFPIYSPPLRDRRADILLLADHFIEKFNLEFNREVNRISTGAIDMLVSYHWPGNVRELENIIHRAVLMSNENTIRSTHMPPSLQLAEKKGEESLSFEGMINQYTREIIIDHLKMTNGNISKAAETLKTTKRIINYKIQQLDIDYKRYKIVK